MKDNKGQVALEYILIFAVSLLILIIFTLPLTELTIQNMLDVSDSLNVKSDLSKIAQSIEIVYGQGQGSKQSLNIQSSKALTIDITSNYISTRLKLNDGSFKNIKIEFNSNLGKTRIPITKGENLIIVEWPVGNENMRIYKD